MEVIDEGKVPAIVCIDFLEGEHVIRMRGLDVFGLMV